MKIKPLLAGILVASLLCAVFSSCRFFNKEEIGGEESVVCEAEPETDAPQVIETLTEPEVVETESERTTVPGFTEVNSFREMALDREGVMDLYIKTVNEVKIRCPGFTKKDYETIEDVSAGGGRLKLANRILGVVTSELLGPGSSSVKTVRPHSDVDVIESFPVYNEGFGCGLTNYDIIGEAQCSTDGTENRIVITVRDTLNPDPDNSEFGKILCPVNRENVASGIASFLSGMDLSKYIFDFNYTGNEITCVIDRETGKLKSLTQKMIIKVDIDLDLDLFLFSTDLIEAHGTIIHKTEYTDFIWE
ncbi:MAG: hypothetical protein IJS90_08185 [Clostridia bacterium]|nr:hypothetical protein [Clostridia bacterium]